MNATPNIILISPLNSNSFWFQTQAYVVFIGKQDFNNQNMNHQNIKSPQSQSSYVFILNRQTIYNF
mgnify:CR=1 FL=1